MNFGASASSRYNRPGSGRPQSSRNPITGEERPLPTPSRADNPPQREVQQKTRIPGLNLQYLKETEDYVYKPIEIGCYPDDTPPQSGRTDVSWGTDICSIRSYREGTSRQSNGAMSGRSSRPADVTELALGGCDDEYAAPPSGRNKPPASGRQHQQVDMEEALLEVKEKHPGLNVQEEDLIEKGWTRRQQQATNQYLRKMDAEDLMEHNKKLKMVETVMIDQLSRAVISDPEQNLTGQVGSEVRRHRGSNRALHDSKVRTKGTATENLLSKRVRFGARVLTRNGHDAIRELTGFFFSVDNTMTIYEFRQFGKSAKALPFVGRGRFCHLQGLREGEPYTLTDICAGNTIRIPTAGQHTLPETQKKVPEITFCITEVDEDEKKQILLHGVPAVDREEVYARLHIPNKQEYTEKMVMKSIRTNVQKKIRKRAIRTITGLGRFYRKADSSGSGVLYRYELEKGLFDFHIDLPPDTLDALFEILDMDEKGELDYSAYMRAVLGTMVEVRKSLVRKAFRKIDASKKGCLTLCDIHKFFNSTFRSARDAHGDREVSPLQAFLDAVVANKRQEQVTYVEFEEYYEGLSLSVESDEEFFSILCNTWTL